MLKTIDPRAFEIDGIRHARACENNLEALRNTYENGACPELPDMSSAELWDNLAAANEAPPFRLRRLHAVAQQIPAGSDVLDVGIGWGEIIPMIMERGNCHYTGLDFSENIVSEVGKKHPDCKFIVGNLSKVETLHDIVLALEVCEHILPSRIMGFYAEINRVLERDGAFIVTVPVYENLRAMTLRCPECGHLHNRMGHVRAYTPELITAELKLAGFAVEKSFFIYANFDNSFAGTLKRRLVDLGRRLFNLGKTMPLNIVIVARKLPG